MIMYEYAALGGILAAHVIALTNIGSYAFTRMDLIVEDIVGDDPARLRIIKNRHYSNPMGRLISGYGHRRAIEWYERQTPTQ